MQIEFSSIAKRFPKHWYIPMILGIFFIMIGMWIFRIPETYDFTPALFFSGIFLVAGILEILHALINRKVDGNWAWSFTVGVIDIFIGIIILTAPTASVTLLPYLIGFGMLFRATRVIGWSVYLKKNRKPDWIILLTIAILGAMFGFVSLWYPWFGGTMVISYTGLAFLLVGTFQVYLSLNLKRLSV